MHSSTKAAGRFGIMSAIKCLRYVVFHPFDGFYIVKSLKKEKYLVAAVLMVLYGLLQIIGYQYTGFIINNNPIFRMNSIRIFTLGLFPIILFIISNWSVTTIFDGSGKLGDIFVVTCFSLLPKIVFDFTGIILSNFIIYEELPILAAFMSIGTLWFCFLVFSGLCVTHEYTAFTNIKMLIATFVAAIIIVFLMMLYLSLMGKMTNFVLSIFKELSKRW